MLQSSDHCVKAALGKKENTVDVETQYNIDLANCTHEFEAV